MDSISEARLSLVHPKLAEKVRQMAEMLELEGIRIRVTQGLRSWDEQAKLYAQGRTAPGAVVTKAPPGHSYHQFGLAVDVVPFDDEKQPDWNVQHPVWQRLVSCGTSLGLEAGAQWRSFPDFPHFQLTGSLPVSPNDTVRQCYLDGGCEKVWEATGL